MTVKKFINRFILTLLLTAIGLFGLVAGLTWVFRDKIIGVFVGEANKYLATPVKVGKIDFTIWHSFPHASIMLDNIEIQGSLANDSLTMLKAENIWLTFNVWDVWDGNYSVNQIQLRNATANLVVDSLRGSNFDIFKKNTNPSTENAPLAFDLHKILLDRVRVRYINRIKQQDMAFYTKESHADFGYQSAHLDIALKGEIDCEQIMVAGNSFFVNKAISINSQISYEKANQRFVIKQGEVGLQKAFFDIKGQYDGDINKIHLSVTGKNSTIQLLLSFLPVKLSHRLAQYKSGGNIFFNGTVDGITSETQSPEIAVSFGCDHARFYEPDLGKAIEHVQLKGSFNNGVKTGHAELSLRNISGTMDGKSFNANFLMQDLKDPFIAADFDGEFSLEGLHKFYPVNDIEKVTGDLVAQLNLEGKISDLKDPHKKNKVKFSGNLKCTEFTFKFKNHPKSLENGKFDFQFNNNDINITELSGTLGKNNFQLNGLLKNVLSYAIFPTEKLNITAKYTSDYTDINELLAFSGAPRSANQEQTTVKKDGIYLPERISCALNCKMDRMVFRRFDLRQCVGHVLMENEHVSSEGISARAVGGRFNIDGDIEVLPNHGISIDSHLKLDGIHIDSAMYLFENFGQKFITDKNLGGQVMTDIKFKGKLTPKLDIDLASVSADINLMIKNGELVNFEPLKKLSKFIDEKELADIHFSELKNNFHIENQTILIPEMEIKSNVNTISVMGTHTFDNHMDYKVKLSLKNPSRKDKDERFGAVEKDSKGGLNLLITVKGTPDNLKYAYDRSAVKQSIKDGWKKEKEEFKTILKKEKATDKAKPKDVQVDTDNFIDTE